MGLHVPRLVKLLVATATALFLYANHAAFTSPPPASHSPVLPLASSPPPPTPISSHPPPPLSTPLHGAVPSECTPRPDGERRALLRRLSTAASPPVCDRSPLCTALAAVLSAAPPTPVGAAVLLTAAHGAQAAALAAFVEAAVALRLPTLVLHAAGAEKPRLDGAGEAVAAVALGAGGELEGKWRAIGAILRAGVGVLYADVDAILAAPPFEYLHADSDVEALSEAWEEDDARGFVMGSDDPSMGWSRYCESMRIAQLDPSLLFLLPTHAAAALATRMATLASAGRWRPAAAAAWAAGPEEGAALTAEVLAPAYDRHTRVGVTSRVLQTGCWLGATASAYRLHRFAAAARRPVVAFAAARRGGGGAARQAAAVRHFHRGAPLGGAWLPAAPLPSRGSLERTRMDLLMFAPRQLNESKALVLRTKCARQEARGSPFHPIASHVATPTLPAPTSLPHRAVCLSFRSTPPAPTPTPPCFASLSARPQRRTPPPLRLHLTAALRSLAHLLPRVTRRQATDEPEGMGGARELRLLAPPGGEWPLHCDEQPELCAVVKEVAIDRAVMAAVSNRNILPMLGQFVDVVQRVGVKNFLVVALDQITSDFLKKKGCANYVRTLRSRSGSTDNHATSGLKFQILHEMLSVGVSVLLSDVDIVITQNPFVALYRDSDVEGMSDGWDERTAYGHVHELPFLDSTLHSLRIVARNSGLFYLSATHECLRMMRLLADTMARVDIWDQSAFNMEIFRPAYASKVTAGVSVRVMNFLCFVNTKLLFKYMRYDPQLGDASVHRPVTAHMNYHPEKEARMASVNRFYHQGDPRALDMWNGGEGQRTGGCRGKVGVMSSTLPALAPAELQSHVLVKHLLEREEGWVWRGYGRVHFERSGALRTEGGALDGATWGTVPSPWRKDSLHVKMGGHEFILMFLSEKWAFVALRCEDEQVTYGTLDAPTVPQNRLVF
ncbi:hypothetical protein AB1Y20_011298 [Prymnesium parvum]|uniref:Nucleotide-diphospho-sugar transferase domain-containing protein n=1 Tax=Prymnesium parvum TaxID=97485 RepID=A0AB34IMH4_PRYPA